MKLADSDHHVSLNATLHLLSYLGVMGGAPWGSRIPDNLPRQGSALATELTERVRKMVETIGIEPTTACLQGRCSPS